MDLISHTSNKGLSTGVVGRFEKRGVNCLKNGSSVTRIPRDVTAKKSLYVWDKEKEKTIQKERK